MPELNLPKDLETQLKTKLDKPVRMLDQSCYIDYGHRIPDMTNLKVTVQDIVGPSIVFEALARNQVCVGNTVCITFASAPPA